jgi:hypothetical protein
LLFIRLWVMVARESCNARARKKMVELAASPRHIPFVR